MNTDYMSLIKTLLTVINTVAGAGVPGLIAVGMIACFSIVFLALFNKRIQDAKIEQQKIESNQAHSTNQTNNSTVDQNAANAESSIEDIINKG